MAVVDLTNTPLGLITSDAVVRGIHTTTIKIDLKLNSVGATAATEHLIFSLPAGAAVLPATAGFVTEAIATGAGKGYTFSKSNGGGFVDKITGVAKGTGFTMGAPFDDQGGLALAYDEDPVDIRLNLEAVCTTGVIVLVLVWAELGNALSAGYREGDGTV